jgi:ABC-type oligopeptide transport system substrate-binding subunit
MKKIVGILVLALLSLSLIACQRATTSIGAESGGSTASEETPVSEEAPTPKESANPLAAEQAQAYFAVFQTLYEEDSALNSDSKYLALDLSKAKLEDTTPLIEKVQEFCEEKGYTLLLDNHEGLVEKGYVTDLHFEEGFIISFEDEKLNEKTLITNAQKWRSGNGAIGAKYTVKQKNGTWTITNTTDSWIS